MEDNQIDDSVFADFEKWPFSTMAIGEVVSFVVDETGKAKKAQIYVHVYAGRCGRKYKTRTIKRGGEKLIAIKREG